MKPTSFRTIVLVFILLLTACSAPQLSGSADVTQKAPAALQATQTAMPQAIVSTYTASPLPSATMLPTNTPQPTNTPTATVPPEPVFDPGKVVDVASLDSYKLLNKFSMKSTKADNKVELYYSDLSVEYQKNPKIYHAIEISGNALTANGDIVPWANDDNYWIDNFKYSNDHLAKGWLVRIITAKSNQKYVENGLASYGFGNVTSSLQNPHFAGKEVLNSIPVFHFTFNETNFAPNPKIDSTVKNRHVEGNLYIAQDGNYLVRYDSKGFADINTDSPEAQKVWGDTVRRESEEVIDLVSVNQGKGISLPADAPKTDRVVDTPLPPEAELAQITNYGSLSYIYNTSKTVQETVDYYRNLTYPADWKYVDVMSDNPTFATVILRKGTESHLLNVHFNQYSGWTEISVDFFGG